MPGTPKPSDTARARKQPTFVAAGRVMRPHGVRGELRVEAVSHLMRSLQAGSRVYLGSRHAAARVASARLHGRHWLVRLEGCGDRETAERWRGAELGVRVDDLPPLPEGEYFYWQILGLQVVTEDGRALGTIEEILETGANDVYIVRSPDRPEVLLPAIQSVIRQVDLAAGEIRVRLIPGLIPGV
jgi:16S rRNA processing protein RimM